MLSSFAGIIGFLLPIIISGSIAAQNTGSDSLRRTALKVFIDCGYGCDMEDTKREITFINFVTEPKEADLHILVTAQPSGSGGNEFSFFFMGQRDFSSMSDTLKASAKADNTWDETRELTVRTLKLGLMRYVAHTPLAQNISIAYDQTEDAIDAGDKWKNWVFGISGNFSMDGRKHYRYLYGSGTLQARRITPDWKIIMRFYGYYSEQQFDVSSKDVFSYSRSYSFYNLMVRSISDHWSYGYSLYMQNSTYSNYDLSTWLMPAIEYDVFPYSQSSRRQLRLFYKIGPLYNDYTDTTIYNKTKELLFFQRFTASFEMINKWGDIYASLYASNFLHDFSKYNISLYSGMNIRIVKGLSFNFSGQYSMIHDQLSLPKAGASEEEVLLQRREQATQFSYYLNAGLTYTFGSIYNNIVNPRFGE